MRIQPDQDRPHCFRSLLRHLLGDPEVGKGRLRDLQYISAVTSGSSSNMVLILDGNSRKRFGKQVFSKVSFLTDLKLNKSNLTYRVTPKLPQICTVILRICIGKVA